MTAASAFFFAVAFTTSALYRFQMAGLNPLQLVLLGTALEVSVFLFEIPTGIVADIYSRRLSVIIGFALIGLGMLIEGSFQFFITILLAQVVWGTGYTFISGAQDAWLADEIGEERLAPAYLRGSQLAQLAALTGIAVNVALASVQLNLPFLFAGIGHIGLALFLILYMPERGFTPTPQEDRHTWRKMDSTFREGMSTIRQRPLLVTILGIALVYGLYSEALDRLWEAHILDSFTLPQIGNMSTVAWFGFVNAAIMIIVIGTTELVRRRASKLDHHNTVRVLALFSGVMSAGLVLFGLASSFVIALLSFSTVSITRRTMEPLYSAWINRGIPSQVRATVLSTYGQMDAIGQTLGGPAIGVVANMFGLRSAIVLAGVLLTPVLALYRRAYNQGSESQSIESFETST